MIRQQIVDAVVKLLGLPMRCVPVLKEQARERNVCLHESCNSAFALDLLAKH